MVKLADLADSVQPATPAERPEPPSGEGHESSSPEGGLTGFRVEDAYKRSGFQQYESYETRVVLYGEIDPSVPVSTQIYWTSQLARELVSRNTNRPIAYDPAWRGHVRAKGALFAEEGDWFEIRVTPETGVSVGGMEYGDQAEMDDHGV
jgi:hypothetical protein